LAASSPGLNAVERRFRVIKHGDLSDRVYPSIAALEAAGNDVDTRFDGDLLNHTAGQQGLAG
jgi:hypothetical protein